MFALDRRLWEGCLKVSAEIRIPLDPESQQAREDAGVCFGGWICR